MERSRSKRGYYYDQDYDSQARTKPRYHHHHNHHHRRRGSGGGGAVRPSKPQEPSPPSAVFFRILCLDEKVGGVIGKSGSIIKAIRHETGAWINVHPLAPGDDERIIEISDASRREADGRPPSYSPAQDALLMIHERILDCDSAFGEGSGGSGNDDDDYGPRGSGAGERVVTRLVVPRSNVGSLLGKGGKIIEQMRSETKTQIRVLPRDHNLPRCVSMSEEIVQVVGDSSAVKKAMAIISSRLKESLLRDRGSFRGRLHSPERFFPPDDDFIHMSSAPFRSALEVPASGPRSGAGLDSVRSNSYVSRPSGFASESAATPIADHAQFFGEEIVFRILCPNDKVESVMGESDGIIDILRGDVGVDVSVTDPVPGSAERIIIVSSEEGPEDELFPAQEALLHIQSRIVDLGADKDNIITRLLVPATEIGCLEGRDGSLNEMRRLTRANIQILPKEELPLCAWTADELVQIVGDIRAARDALVQVTLRLRSYLYRDVSISKDLPPPPPVSATGHIDANSPNRSSAPDDFKGSDPSTASYQTTQSVTTTLQSKDGGRSGSGLPEQEATNAYEEGSGAPLRPPVPIATKRIMEVVIPEHAVPSLIMRSGSKLSQISEMSGATVTLVEDRPEQPKRVVQISGSPEQAERAQSLLQGFILSTQDDAPTS